MCLLEWVESLPACLGQAFFSSAQRKVFSVNAFTKPCYQCIKGGRPCLSGVALPLRGKLVMRRKHWAFVCFFISGARASSSPFPILAKTFESFHRFVWQWSFSMILWSFQKMKNRPSTWAIFSTYARKGVWYYPRKVWRFEYQGSNSWVSSSDNERSRCSLISSRKSQTFRMKAAKTKRVVILTRYPKLCQELHS